MKLFRQVFNGKACPDVAVSIDPTLYFLSDFGMVGRRFLRRFGLAAVVLFISFHCTFHLLVKQQIIQITKEEIDIERD